MEIVFPLSHNCITAQNSLCTVVCGCFSVLHSSLMQQGGLGGSSPTQFITSTSSCFFLLSSASPSGPVQAHQQSCSFTVKRRLQTSCKNFVQFLKLEPFYSRVNPLIANTLRNGVLCMGCEYLHKIPEGKQVELTLATVYFPFSIGSECIVLLRSSGVDLNEKKPRTVVDYS